MSQTVVILQDAAVIAVSGQEGASPRLQTMKKKVLSGFGEPYEKWKDALLALKQEMDFSKARIVLPAALCATKIIQIPFVKGKQLVEMVEREAGDTFKSAYHDYTVLAADKKYGMTICCGSMEKTVYDRLKAMFSQAGITPTGMTVPLEGYLKLLMGKAGAKNQTAIYLFFEEAAVTRILIQKGHYRYSGRNRIFSEPGTMDYGTEIVRNISGILQFQTASKSGETITDVYYSGCADVDFSVATERILDMDLKPQALDLSDSAQLPAGESPADWAESIAAMIFGIRGKHDMNLMKDSREVKGKENVSVPRQFLLPVVILILCVAVTFGLRMLGSRYTNRTAEYQEWMGNEAVTKQHDEALALESKIQSLSTAITTVKQSEENLATYPDVTTELWSQIQAAGGDAITATLQGYDSETGMISFLATSTQVIDIPSYVKQLQNTGVFYQVSYTGYTYEDGVYQLSLSCTLAAEETQEENADAAEDSSETSEAESGGDGQ